MNTTRLPIKINSHIPFINSPFCRIVSEILSRRTLVPDVIAARKMSIIIGTLSRYCRLCERELTSSSCSFGTSFNTSMIMRSGRSLEISTAADCGLSVSYYSASMSDSLYCSSDYELSDCSISGKTLRAGSPFSLSSLWSYRSASLSNYLRAFSNIR